MSYINTFNQPDSAVSAFGDLVAVDNTPVIQLDFVYGANTNVGTLSSASSGTADTNGGRLRLQSGTNTAGSAVYVSLRPAKYRQGQGVTARFTTAFATSAASNTQIVGMGTTTDGYFVGFNGTAFGVLHRNGGADTWVAQASFNGDVLDGTGPSGMTLNKTFGNVWMIRYPFLGYGAVKFFVSNSQGHWILFHSIEYPNTTATLQITNPNLPFRAQSINSGSSTNCTLYVGSVGVFINGERKFLGPKYGTGNRKAAVTTQTNIFSLRNATTYNGVLNQSLLRLRSVTAAWDGANNTGLLNIIKNPTLGGSPSYTPISGSTANSGVTITSGQSITSVDTAGTTITGGVILFNAALARNSNMVIDLETFDIFIEPGSILSFSVTGDSSGDTRVAATWVEDI